MDSWKYLAVAILIGTLSGCGGGSSSSDGGGSSGADDGSFEGDGVSIKPEQFTSFADISGDAVVRIDGIMVSGEYEDYNGIYLDRRSIDISNEAYAIASFEDKRLVRLELKNANNSGRTVVVDTSNGGEIFDRGRVSFGQSANGDDYILFIDGADAGFDHQISGTFLTGYSMNFEGHSDGYFGSGSFGAVTPFEDIPRSSCGDGCRFEGPARVTYLGTATGFYKQEGSIALTLSDIQLGLDLESAGSPHDSYLEISSSDTELWDPETFRFIGELPGLDFAGRQSLVSSRPGDFFRVEGKIMGEGLTRVVFYGPAAEESGGNFLFRPPEDGHEGKVYVGSFGAKR